MPKVPAPDAVQSPHWNAPVEWAQRYELLQLDGPFPQQWDTVVPDAPPDQASLSRLWMRDAPPRPLDWCALTALADVFYPRVFLRRRRQVPAGTVSMTVHFHADPQLWNAAGTLLATSSQVVYYKE